MGTNRKNRKQKNRKGPNANQSPNKGGKSPQKFSPNSV